MNHKINREKESEDEIICYCQNVSKKEIVAALESGASSLADVQRITRAGTGSRCKELNSKGVCCHRDIVDLLNSFNKKISNSKQHGKCSCCENN